MESGVITTKLDSRLTQFCILSIPIMMFVGLRVIGQVYLTELILLVLLPGLLLKRGHRLRARLPRSILVLGGLWLASQILTDAYRGTPFEDWARGWARIGLFLLEIAALYLLLRGDRMRMLLFLAGIAIGFPLVYVFAPSVNALQEPWKFAYGPFITLLVVVLANLGAIRRRVPLQLGLLATIGVVNLAMGSRAAFLLCFVAAAYVFMSTWRNRRLRGSRPHRERLWRAVTVGVIVAVVAGIGYGYSAQQGWLGARAATKYAAQSGGRYGVFLGGRVGVMVSSQAILDSPVLGHGSWAKSWEYQNLLDRRLAQLGYGGSPYLGEGVPPIPSHSYLLGAWVESGVLGAVFWALVLLVTYRAARQTYGRDDPFIVLFAFMAATLLWSVLFSPFTAQERVYAAFYIVVVLSFARPTRTFRDGGASRRATPNLGRTPPSVPPELLESPR